MRVLLSHKLPYSKGYAGATRTVRSIARMLAQRGHETIVVCRDSFATIEPSNFNLRPDLTTTQTTDHGVKVYALPNEVNFEMSLNYIIELWKPDCILIGEDPTYLSLAVAIEKSVNRIIVLIQSQSTLPFGPESFYRDKLRTDLLKSPAEIVVFSRYVKTYVKKWGQFDSVLLPHFLKEQLDADYLDGFENPSVLLINASKIKGLPIFTKLVQRFPSVQFAAVKGWATTSIDIENLSQHENVRILEPKENVDEIYSQSRVLLVPSLWGEAFGYVALEAMARGIPVISSDVGGLPEAKLGVDYLLPVTPISEYHEKFDERLLPEPIIPEQNLEPWHAALQTLLNDSRRYHALADESRSVAMKYVQGLDESVWLKFIEGSNSGFDQV